MGKSVNYYLTKINRFFGWLLLAVMVIYVCSGLALCGKFGFDRLNLAQEALALHKQMIWPLLAVLLPHSILSVYFALRRWGWIGTRTKS